MSAVFDEAIETWAEHFGLGDWRIVPAEWDVADDAYAEVEIDVEAKLATYAVSEELPHSEVSAIALHEVLHVVFADMLSPDHTEGSRASAEHAAINRIIRAMGVKP